MSSNDQLKRLHETWLGMVQPVEGLVFSPTVLADKGIGRPDEGPAQLQQRFLAAAPPAEIEDGKETQPRIHDLPAFLEEMLELTPDLFDTGDDLPPELSLDVPEADQVLRPTLALKKQFDIEVPEGTDATEAAKAGAAYEMLVWDLAETHTDGIGLSLDKPEEVTGDWRYPPTAKFDRLLRHVRVPIGLLTNRDELRLIYAPHGESTGHITFRLSDMAEVGGRPILDAFVSLLSVQRFFGVSEEVAVPALLSDSRKHQAGVTTELAEQVFDALQVLLAGFQAAAERDPDSYGMVFAEGLRAENDHVYRGLLTVMLRLVFLLFAEDRALLPVEHPVYEEHMSVLALFARLQEEAGAHPDSMAQRFGAWGQLLALFRAVYTGVDHGELHMPPRRGDLFDPHRYPFLEGVAAGASPIRAPELQAQVTVPTIDDGTVFAVLERLIIFEGQRLSYKALDVEQIGSVYEALMGYHVERMTGPAVRMKSGQWLTVDEVLAVKPAQRAKWLQKDVGLAKAQAATLSARFKSILSVEDENFSQSRKDAKEGSDGADGSTLGAFAPLRELTPQRAALVEALADYSTAGRKKIKSAALARPMQLVLQPGAERRRTSSHYTPRSLSVPIVERTLEPLIAAMGDTPSAAQLLELKVCDPAMGSGAFLVAACGYLADQVVAAWTREGTLAQIAEDAPNEDPVLYARRLVAQRCLYGVDKNDAAVELAKLSLWLFTLARDMPFTFLDHALRHGDSLVGLSFEQIRSFTWEPVEGGQQVALARAELDQALEEAIPIRQQILALAEDGSPEGQAEKARLVADAADALGRARLIGDLIVGAFFAEKKKKARAAELERRWGLVQRWLAGPTLSAFAPLREIPEPEDVSQSRKGAEEEWASVDAELRQMQAAIRDRLPVFHWMLEFPEVFWSKRPDPLAAWETDGEAYMDAFVGNPPFAGKNGIARSGGAGYLDWLQTGHAHAHGNADLSAHFFLRAEALLGEHGTFGLIATNTIAQGDTRATGLQKLVAAGVTLYDATSTMVWPVPGAAVMVAVVHGSIGRPSDGLRLRLDGERVEAINSRLRPTPERPDPRKLPENAGCSFVGSYVLGMGFTLTPDERDELVAKDPRNAERIFPYLGGKEVNTSPTQEHDRYVINFGQMSLAEAEAWPDLLGIVREKVKPERDRNKRDVRRKYWWRFGEVAPALYEAVASLERCLVNSRVSKHLMFSFQPTDRVWAEALYVYPLPRHTSFAVLQSRIHEPWARLLSSSMKNDLRYAASDCFETFPFPEPEPRTVVPALETIGEELYEARATYMVDADQGLTQTYNLLKDPDCQDPENQHLRELHEAMDRAVLNAYGWTDLEVPPFCPATPAEQKAFEAFQDQVIDRLFVLNAKRADRSD